MVVLWVCLTPLFEARRRVLEGRLAASGDVCLRLDYAHDDSLLHLRRAPLHFLKVSSQQELRMLYQHGQAYARVLTTC